MKCLAFLAAAAMLAVVAADVHADNQFRIGSRPTRGRVRVELNGGAGANPRFEIGGRNRRDFNRFAARRVASNNFPVAVGYGGGWGGNCYFGDGGFSNLYNQGFIPVPPYYSLHPPVYYSAPVPRTYGYSPFAYPGNVPTPEITMGPEEIINPHIEPEEVPAPAQEASGRTASAPQVIRNPYVEQAQPVSFTADAR